MIEGVGWLEVFTNLREMRLLSGCFAFHNCNQAFLARREVITAVLSKLKYSGKLYLVEYY